MRLARLQSPISAPAHELVVFSLSRWCLVLDCRVWVVSVIVWMLFDALGEYERGRGGTNVVLFFGLQY